MALAGKHTFGEIDGTRVTFVEKKIGQDRVDFLTELLELNGFEVLLKPEKKKSEDDPDLFTLGVTDMVFNPTVWIYQRRLKTRDGRYVTADYWNQETKETHPQYWRKALK